MCWVPSGTGPGLAWPCRVSKALSTNVHNPRIQKESSWSPQPSLTKEEQNRNSKEVVGGGNKVSHPSLTPTYRTILAAPFLPSPALPAMVRFCLAQLRSVLFLSKPFSQGKTWHLSLHLKAQSVLISSCYSITSLVLTMNYQVKNLCPTR